ncbi:MAG: rod shape-determining protein MreC [candidate division KSB1 bacterium]
MLERPSSLLVSSREYFVLFAAIVAALAILFNNDAPQLEAIRSFAVDRYAAFHVLADWKNWRDYTPEEVSALRQRTTQLLLENSQLREAYLENVRLRRMLEYDQRAMFELRAARVLFKESNSTPNTVVIDLGESAGVQVNMPVITPEGLAGKVLKVNERTSHVQLLLDRDFSASARIQRSRVLGIATWMNSQDFEMTGVARHADVVTGDVVVTSDSSALFPPGLRIGIVLEPTVEQSGMFKKIPLLPAVNFSRLEEVFVLMPAANLRNPIAPNARTGG